ncbi:MAG: acyl-CoA thioesterase [Candidatus Krumholzibacteriia bacterium]
MTPDDAAARRRLRVELPVRVKWYDVDVAAIVHNAVYIRWLEDLRQQILEDHLPLAEQFAAGYAPVLAHTEIDYRRPITLHDRVLSAMWIPEIGDTRWTARAEFLIDDGPPAAVAMQWGVFFDLKTKRPIPLPAKLREAWERSAQG